MQKYISTLLLLFIFSSLTAQDKEKNIFLDREFWKAAPTVDLIKAKIAEGHDPTERDLFSFDGVSYGIIDHAPLASLKYMLSLEGNPVTKPTHGDVTYLLWAAYRGNIPLIQHLIDLESDVHFKTTRGTNILLMSGFGSQEDLALYDLLLANGVDIHSTNSGGTNILLALAGSDAEDRKVFHYLVDKGLDWHYRDAKGNGLFHYAARAGNLENMDLCLEENVKHDYLNSKGENAMFYAAYGRKRSEVLLKTFMYLDSLGLEADIVNWDGQSPLHHVVRRGNPAVIDFFIDKGVNINQIDKDGNTAFLNAAYGKLENVKKLLPYISNIDQVNQKGHSPLSNAVAYAKKDIFDFLMEQGADITILDEEQNDLYSLAFQFYSERRKDNFEYILNALSAKGLKAKHSYANGNTLAHYAIEKDNPYLIQKALEMEIDLNIKNDLGLTALHLAVMKARDSRTIDLLLNAGADKNILTDFEESTYDLAIENEILMENNIDLSNLQSDE
ncbi:MAG: ankyrin repeat domain-containing protein [Bacteroidota bacterium]